MTDSVQKRTVADSILWGLFAVPILGFIGYLSFLFGEYHEMSTGSAIGLAAGVAVLTLGIGVLISLLARRMLGRSFRLLGMIAPFVAMMAVIGLRVWYLMDGSGVLTGNLALYTDTLITEQAFVPADWLTDPFTGIVQNLLRLSFRLFGNTGEAAAFSLLILQTGSALVFYIAVRNLSGHLGAFLATLLVFVNPDSIRSIYEISAAHGLMAVLCGMLLLYSVLIRLIRKSGKSAYMGVLLLFGMANGFLFFREPLFVATFLLLLLYYITYGSAEQQRIYKSFLILIQILGFTAGFFLHCLVTYLNTEMDFLQVMTTWGDDLVRIWNPDAGILIAGEHLLYLLVPAVLAAVYILYYWMVGMRPHMAFYGTTVFVFAAWLCTDAEYAGLFFFVSICILAGVMYQNCLPQQCPGTLDAVPDTEDEPMQDGEDIVVTQMDDLSTPLPVGTDVAPGTDSVAETDSAVGKKAEKPLPGQPLPNPLAVPKKHVKREPDYAFSVSDEKMTFDIDIDDQDDYDI